MNQETVLLNGVHCFLNTICIKFNLGEIPDMLNWSCFAKFSQFKSALSVWFVARFEATAARWCDNATVGHPMRKKTL